MTVQFMDDRVAGSSRDRPGLTANAATNATARLTAMIIPNTSPITHPVKQ
jgi:hypothetical protein